MNSTDLIDQAIKKMVEASYMVAFTGAGISVESGIPPFRGEDGLWGRYDPEILELDFFLNHPDISWPAIKEIFYTHFDRAKPNSAHRLLALLEQRKMLKGVITQNIDSLHQQAGSQTVYCFHGNSAQLVCVDCHHVVSSSNEVMEQDVPRCELCGGLLKPDFIFFGEAIPQEAYHSSFAAARACDVMLVVGTTGEVYPAALVPAEAKSQGAFIIEINPTESVFSRQTANIHLKMKAGDAAEIIANKLNIRL